ncbi:MAG: hypothetical protein ABSC47_02435 [Terracidiphilus sp.]|jgi:hypothetical protein
MKTIPALLVAVVLISPAFAQTTAPQEIQKHLKGPFISPAFKPILLHTGKPIIQGDKQQLRFSVLNSYMKIRPGTKITTRDAVSPAALTAMITPQQMYKTGFVDTIAYQPMAVRASSGSYFFNPGASSALTFEITVNPNTTYTLTVKVGPSAEPSNPQFTVYNGEPGNPEQNPETFTGNIGTTEFAYAFVANGAGVTGISIYSPNAKWWTFVSCEITATPLN